LGINENVTFSNNDVTKLRYRVAPVKNAPGPLALTRCITIQRKPFSVFL